MWHWIRHWRDWVINERLPLSRMRSQAQPMHCSYEKAGLTLHQMPIPWNAEAVLVEAMLRLPAQTRRKIDFTLRIAGQPIIPAESLRRFEGGDDRHRIFFRLPTPSSTVVAQLMWKEHVLGDTKLTILTADEFRRDLRLQSPTMFVRIGEQSVAAQTFVATQCRGLMATAMLRSSTYLAPLIDLELHVEFRSERTGLIDDVPVPMCSSQMSAKEAILSASPRKHPRRMGVWTATWKLGDQVLWTQQVRAISQKTFQQSLRISDTRFVVGTDHGMHLTRQPPTLSETKRVGPAFLVSSREAGLAGLCPLSIHGQVPGAISPPMLLEKSLLVTDGPTLFAPGTLDVSELGQISAFELRMGKQVLGVLSLHPVPEATFNSEGGFRPPPEFSWSPIADEELSERLGKLLG